MLSTLIWMPVLGALIIGFLPGNLTASRLRFIALAIASLILLVTIWLGSQFDLTSSGLQFQEYLPWISDLGLSYNLGVDGLSFPLLALSSLLTWIVIYSSNEIERSRIYYALILLVNAAVAGAFVSQNLLLFIIFYELELIPLYLLINIWGGPKRGYAATKFLIYTAVSGVLILAAFLGMTWLSNSTSFDYELIITQGLPLTAQLILLTMLLVGFGIKIPLVPLHTWLPDAYTEASPPVAILLGGVLAKLGTYGLIRFGLGLFPETWEVVAPGLAIIGTISVLYGALNAIAQKDIKRMVAYSSIGHMGYVLLGGAAANSLSLVGTISQMVAHGLILALLFHLVGVIESKVGTRDLDVLNGLLNPIRGLPLTTGLLILAGMASAGIPGLVGFVAEFVVFQGSYSIFPLLTLLCVTGTGLTAVYFVILLNRTCFGKLDNKQAYYPKVQSQERIPALVLAAIIFILGVQPNWLMRWSETTSTAMVAAFINPQQVAINHQPSAEK
ncbi:MAG: NADH-quinone oxidoreductase subunit M [Aphanothece sp. CMT-3BRIN-NPC111]|jgi:NAD(P)H-quinone oxidoreductase subunit 4|nr:NADH-quinone oxidoreductase subunit M [Aphanothece sp. CMT-3BRIN-NPC111]